MTEQERRTLVSRLLKLNVVEVLALFALLIAELHLCQ